METDPGITLERIESFIQGFWWILPNLGIALAVFLLFLGAAWAVRIGISRFFNHRGRPDLAALLAGFARWSTIALGLLVVATIVFPSVKPADVLATLGIGSIAVGFAFKDILQNWLAGLLILLRQPFRQGDQIMIGTHEGTVERIEARATLIRTYDGRRVIIPNSSVYTESVTVNTAFERRRSEYDVGVGYGDDVRKACEVIRNALKDLPGVVQNPAPEAIPWELAGSSINIKVRWWTQPHRADVVSVRGSVILAVRQALGEAGIDLPFPTNVVLLHDQTEEADGDRSRQREGWPAGDNPPAARHLNEISIERGDEEESSDTGFRPTRRRQ
ncbi:mechanosensitive ion channel family protein [Microvirga splendida]|uniref:Small-conductance mechanosensitive channel n=1 Tax=Microvirga splendida TaxID=2795727 RepID=A0ABS0Y3V7_9HYPH|nr:mechanosensitive ion channel family protein [Microvirga splendida]MBJ6126989.1 mechanosensitive ion channel family protein [Microvirga splendida]